MRMSRQRLLQSLPSVLGAASVALVSPPLKAGDSSQAPVVAVTHVGIAVSDIRKTLALFRDVLGATLEEPRVVPSGTSRITGVPNASIIMVYVTLGGQRIEFVQHTNPIEAPSTLRPSNPGHFHIGLVLSDYSGTLQKLREAGFTGPVPEMRNGLPRPVYMTNSDGLVLELFPKTN